MRARTNDILHLAGAAAVAVSAAFLAVVALVTFTKPSEFDARVAHVVTQAGEAEALLRRSRSQPDLPPGGVCATPAKDAQALATRLAALAAAEGLSDAHVQVTPQAARAATHGLVPLSVRFDASGPYESALGAITHLKQLRPTVLVDTVDLQSKTAFVTLALSGRAFCSAPHSS